jgi:sn-glycerol 3-phosphate transport system substrate-binding protein
MLRTTSLLAATAAVALALAAAGRSGPAAAQGAAGSPIELQWWHAMTSVNGDRVNKLAEDFNASQTAYKIVPVFKGTYAETMNAGIAAFRAGSAPHIIQIFEVGTATMMAAKGAVKPVYQMMADAKEPFDPKSYLPAITGYYSTADGRMLSLPFNASTAVAFYNKDAFRKAGLDPEKAPKTWPEWFDAAKKLRASGMSCGFTAGWITWTQIEEFSVWHNLPIATEANGLGGTGAQIKINGPLQVKHIQTLAELQKDKTFDYGGRTTEPEGKFTSGECGMIQTSSGYYGIGKANAKFDFGVAELPYYPDAAGAPQNTIIGGASLWVMGGKKPEEYAGVAKFFSYLSQTPVQRELHEVTGYLPITKAAYEATKASGFYEKNPGREVPIQELTNKEPTDNSRGLRLGNLAQIRDAWAEELETAFAGKQTAQQALDDAVKRGDAVLRQFEKTAK